MSDPLAIQTDALVVAWLQCVPEEEEAWLAQHLAQITLAFLETLKVASDKHLRTNPQIAEAITGGMLRVAQAINEPLALPLAWWARGNYFGYIDPQQAILCFQRALDGYRPTENSQAILVLISNLLYVTTEIDLGAAQKLYEQEIIPWRQRATANDYPTLLRVEQNAGILLRRLGYYAEALTTHQHALQLAEQTGQRDRVAEILGNLALTLGSMGRFAECEAHFLASREIAITSANQLTAARMEMNLGELYAVLGRPAEALRALQDARIQFTMLNNSMEIASVALREAHLLERIGALAQSCRHYRMAQSYFRVLQMWPQVWQATLEGAVAHRKYGEYGQAALLLAEAADLWQQHAQSVWQSEWHLEKAALALAQGQLAEAEKWLNAWQRQTPRAQQTARLQARYDLYSGQLFEAADSSAPAHHNHDQADAESAYQHVLAYAEQQGELQMKRQALAGLGKIIRQHDPQRAKEYLLYAAEQDDLIRAGLSVQELKAGFLHQHSRTLETLFIWAFAEQQYEAALHLSWRAKGSALLELLTPAYPGAPEHGSVEEVATAATRNQLASLHWQAALEANRLNRPQPVVEAEMPDIARLEQQLIDLRRQRNRQNLHMARLNKQEIHALSKPMAADLLIEYMQAEDQLYATVMDSAGICQTFYLTDIDTILDLLDELTLTFRAQLTMPPAQRSQAQFMVESQQLLAKCYELLFRPLQIPPTVTTLLIAPCPPLHKIPFAALWDGEHYLVERQIIELTPTAVLLTVPHPVTAVTHPLVIASSAGGTLPANPQQGEVIRTLFPNATCLIDDPNTMAYLQNLKVAPRFIHIAAHTIEREDTPIFTALQLTDTTFTVEQSYELSLQGTELVTLSSCTTSAGMDSAGSLLAFQSAFFAAGAQRILSTLWEIHSDITQVWMTQFYTNLQARQSPIIALRQTQLKFLQDQQLCHPVYWAAFACSRR